ncbi:diguanylate cyclase [Scleromatobacter humisilvae]|uniref:diguanylate cyclase n=1 Tax=Scleromatobacter humisilvae TaxID=2897159 RepID=A0A9X1YG73_9BURK|nr:diguanylate cyclase [Scleromatobacter humisilvae]MCK9684250.1 diguanylate cyclase [Scleromatobacter humisilvae]
MRTFFRHLRIGHRLVLCFSLILLLMIAGAWLAVSSTRHARESLMQLVVRSNARQADIRDMRALIERQDRIGQRLALVNSVEDAQNDMAAIVDDTVSYRRIEKRFAAQAETVQERTMIGRMEDYDRSVAPTLEVAQASVKGYNPGMAARMLDREAAPLHAAWLHVLDDLAELQNQRVATEIQALSAYADRNDLVIGGVAVLASLMAAFVGWRLTLSITRPLKQAVLFASAVGSGQLDIPLPRSSDDECGMLLLALKVMATQLQEANARMQRLAIEDGLTGAFNRRHFDDVLHAEHERARRAALRRRDDGAVEEAAHLALLLIDVDHFKHFNDRFGHPAGDACLRAVVSAVREAGLRPGDFVARYGGEEFVVVLPSCDLSGAACVAERIRQKVETLHARGEPELAAPVSVSIGLAAMCDARDSTPADLLRAADLAMYDAKHNGRNQVRQRALECCSAVEAPAVAPA